MLIREIMKQPPVLVHQDTTLGEVAQIMLARQLACVAVVDDRGELCGVITEDDFMPEDRLVPFSTERLPKLFGEWMPRGGVERVYPAGRGMKAKDIQKAPAIVVSEGTPVEETLLKMQRQSVRCLPVLRDNVPIGTFSHHEALMMMT
ncbi:MAG: CBS domain-containing protein [Acidobacteria bacterium]|nr:CBS domain-containing protein [Acidobacteriota bacterium]